MNILYERLEQSPAEWTALSPALILCDYCDTLPAIYDVGKPNGEMWATCEPCLAVMSGMERRRGQVNIDFGDRRTVDASDEPIVRE